MARPKEFDVESALERSMDLFLERGYEATSMSDLVGHLGISRQSLYDTFGDKQAIYIAALELWRDQQNQSFLQLLGSDEPIRSVVRRVFEGFIQQDLDGERSRGCAMVNAIVQPSSSDETIARLVSDNARSLEAAWAKRLREAQERGEIGAHHDPVALGRFFASALSGLRVTARTTRDRQALEDVMRVALGVLG
ncbi:TetR/AcrR family transcriptional regulator [Sorangium sp. So ce321]|uniref:TetR/AcrR family transcriptional regulator n=1 Tax=Sorangium sp. So ce321 TaxID=3133300 RepID=UPI003F611078